MDLEATLAGSAETISYAIGGSHSSSDGLYALNNERTLTTANARVGWDAGGRTTLSLSTRFSDGVFHFPTDGAGNPVDANAFLDRRLFTVSAGAAHRFSNTIVAQVEVGQTATEQATIDDPDDPSEVGFSHSAIEVSRSTADLRLRGELPVGTLTVGVGYERSEGSNLYDSFHEIFGEYSTLLEADRTNRALYAEYLGAPLAGVDLTVGGRLDRNETFGTFETFRIGFSRTLGEATRLRGMIGKAFREPTFGENFGEVAFDIGNPDLLPERTRSWEIGIEQNLGPLLLTATWFDQRFKDLIQYTGNPTPPSGPNYVNIGSASAVGLEITAGVGVGALAVEGSLTYLDTEVLDPGISGGLTFVEGEPLLRRPGRSGSVTGRWALNQGSITGTLHIVGEREDIHFRSFPDPSVRVTLDRYATFDLSTS
jgi:vitamin B12 transporter